jgi:flavin reductase (DIM6/NTAB) family NADH-FMN oxidoreductase RutF
MQIEPEFSVGEALRRAMRHWVTGVSIVTSRLGETAHGMTVNSFVSISLDPPVVAVTMNTTARTHQLVDESGIFAVTVLGLAQQPLAELFAGRSEGHGDRFTGLETFSLVTGAPLLVGGIAFLDCRVIHRHPLERSTLFLGEVLAVQSVVEEVAPLVYHNRSFTSIVNGER